MPDTKPFGISEFEAIMCLISDYFVGLHEADIEKLQGIFYPDAYLKAPGLRRSLQQWLALVATRPIPKQQNPEMHYKIQSIQVIKDQAIVVLECPLFEHAYIDCLSLLKEEGQWRIVNKMYTDIRPPMTGS